MGIAHSITEYGKVKKTMNQQTKLTRLKAIIFENEIFEVTSGSSLICTKLENYGELVVRDGGTVDCSNIVNNNKIQNETNGNITVINYVSSEKGVFDNSGNVIIQNGGSNHGILTSISPIIISGKSFYNHGYIHLYSGCIFDISNVQFINKGVFYLDDIGTVMNIKNNTKFINHNSIVNANSTINLNDTSSITLKPNGDQFAFLLNFSELNVSSSNNIKVESNTFLYSMMGITNVEYDQPRVRLVMLPVLLNTHFIRRGENEKTYIIKPDNMNPVLLENNQVSVLFIQKYETVILKGRILNASVILNYGTLIVYDTLFNFKLINLGVLYIRNTLINTSPNDIYNLGVIWKSSEHALTKLTRITDIYLEGVGELKEKSVYVQNYTNSAFRTLIVDNGESLVISGLFRNYDVMINYGSITVLSGAILENYGLIRNYGTIDISGSFMNENGTLYHSGVLRSHPVSTLNMNIGFDVSGEIIYDENSELQNYMPYQTIENGVLPSELKKNQQIELTSDVNSQDTIEIHGLVSIQAGSVVTVNCTNFHLGEQSVIRVEKDASFNVVCSENFMFDMTSQIELSGNLIINTSGECHLNGFINSSESTNVVDVSSCNEVIYGNTFKVLGNHTFLQGTTNQKMTGSQNDLINNNFNLNGSNLNFYTISEYSKKYNNEVVFDKILERFIISKTISTDEVLYINEDTEFRGDIRGHIYAKGCTINLSTVILSGFFICFSHTIVNVVNVIHHAYMQIDDTSRINILQNSTLTNHGSIMNHGLINNDGILKNHHRILGEGIIESQSSGGVIYSDMLISYLAPVLLPSFLGSYVSLRSFITLQNTPLTFEPKTNAYLLKDDVLMVSKSYKFYLFNNDTLHIKKGSVFVNCGNIIIENGGQLINEGYIVNDNYIEVRSGGIFTNLSGGKTLLTQTVIDNSGGLIQNTGNMYLYGASQIVNHENGILKQYNKGKLFIQHSYNENAVQMYINYIAENNSEYINTKHLLKEFNMIIQDIKLADFTIVTGDVVTKIDTYFNGVDAITPIDDEPIIKLDIIQTCENDISNCMYIDNYHTFDSSTKVVHQWETYNEDVNEDVLCNFGVFNAIHNGKTTMNYGTLNGVGGNNTINYTQNAVKSTTSIISEDISFILQSYKRIYIDAKVIDLSCVSSHVYISQNGEITGNIDLSDSLLINMSQKEDFILNKTDHSSSIGINVDSESYRIHSFESNNMQSIGQLDYRDFTLLKHETMHIKYGETVTFYGNTHIYGNIHNYGTIHFGDLYDISENTQFYHTNTLIHPSLSNVDIDLSYHYVSIHGYVHNYGEISIYNETFLYGDILNIYGGMVEIMNSLNTSGIGQIVNYPNDKEPIRLSNPIKDVYKPLYEENGITFLYLSVFLSKFQTANNMHKYLITGIVEIGENYNLVIETYEFLQIQGTLIVKGAITLKGELQEFVGKGNIELHGMFHLAASSRINVVNTTLKSVHRFGGGKIYKYIDLYKNVITREDVEQVDTLFINEMDKRGEIQYKNSHNIKSNFIIQYSNEEYSFNPLECELTQNTYVKNDSCYTNGIYVHFGENELQLIFIGVYELNKNIDEQTSLMNDMISAGINNNVIDIVHNQESICVLKQERGLGTVKINNHSFEKNVTDVKQAINGQLIAILYSNGYAEIINEMTSVTETYSDILKIYRGNFGFVLENKDNKIQFYSILSGRETRIIDYKQILEDDNGISVFKMDNSIEYL